MKYTQEQNAIIQTEQNGLIKINAFAGTGKTTTLQAYAEKNAHKQMLYIVFNRGMREHAEKTFPKNVDCKTSHSLAFRNIGYQYKHKMDLNFWRPYMFFNRMKGTINTYIEAYYLIQTLSSFMQTSDNEITTKHIPSHITFKSLNPDSRDQLAMIASDVWQKLIDHNNTKFPINHDVYLKLYQMSKPNLSKKYDVILLDEAQDTTDCVLDIITNQKSTRIIVGDTHQGIYEWRGATNAMETIVPDHEYDLTQSFRLPNSLADYSNTILSYLKSEKKKIRGNGNELRQYDEATNNKTIICRTNAGLLLEALDNEGPIYFNGGIKSYPFKTVLDAYHLKEGRKDLIKDPFMSSFNDWNEYTTYADELGDPENRFKVQFVNKFQHRIPSIIRGIEDRSVNKHAPNIPVLTTAHKAKGLEWDNIQLGSDLWQFMFIDKFNSYGKKIEDSDALKMVHDVINTDVYKTEEANVMYVAMTRAKHAIKFNDNYDEFFDRAKRDKLIRPTKKLVREFKDYMIKNKLPVSEAQHKFMDRYLTR